MNACPLCNAVARTLLYTRTRSGHVHRCTACGFVYSDPRGSDDWEMMPAFTDHPAAYLANARDRFAVLAEATGIRTGTLLDIGCYDGTFLLAAQELGFTGSGVEPAERGVTAARERGLDVTQATIEEARFAEPFDVVSMIHTIEHFEDPLAVLAKARELVKPEGALLIEAPNFDAWSRRLAGRRWRQFIADHFHFFEPETLRRALHETGFTVRTLTTVGKVMTFDLLADRLARYYSGGLGHAVRGFADRIGGREKTLTLNLGDIMLAVATPRQDG